VVATGRGPRSTILDLLFAKDNTTLIACCTNEVYFMAVDQKLAKIKGQKGTFGKYQMTANVTGTIFNNNLVTGCASGEIYLWAGSSVTKSVAGHKGGICAMFVNREETSKLYTGGNDMCVKIWNE